MMAATDLRITEFLASNDNNLLDADGDASVGGARYRRLETEDGWRYFRYEPVVWQVIARGTNLTLLARGVLDAAAYDSQEQRFRDLGGTELEYCLSTSWSAASVRAWSWAF